LDATWLTAHGTSTVAEPKVALTTMARRLQVIASSCD
jgi:hypothetical protein